MKDLTSLGFRRCGLAALSDLQSPEHKDIFSQLEIEQQVFLDNEQEFRSGQYKWPRDPLHTWSRVWEYPYVYHNIRAWRKNLAKDCMPHVVDVGSGVTFFPFSVAKLGYQVTCVDIDPVVEKDLSLAMEHVEHSPGKIAFRLCNGTGLPFSDSEVDVVYCISVLEHIAHFEGTVSEIARILRPGGLFVLTFDLDLRGDQEIGVERYYQLRTALDATFEPLYSEKTVHLTDILRSDKGTYPSLGVRGWKLPWFLLKQWAIKPLLARKPSSARPPFLLTVMGLVLKKKS